MLSQDAPCWALTPPGEESRCDLETLEEEAAAAEGLGQVFPEVKDALV